MNDRKSCPVIGAQFEKVAFSQKLKMCLDLMKLGGEIKTLVGEVLAIPETHEEPGVVVDSSVYGQIVVNIGSDVSWILLVEHVRSLTPQDVANMAMEIIALKKGL